MARNYRREYDTYHAKPAQRKNRSERNKARRALVNAGRVQKGDGMDVHHRDGNPRNNQMKNLSVMPRGKNRSKNKK